MLSTVELGFQLVPDASIKRLFLLRRVLSIETFIETGGIELLSDFETDSIGLLQRPLGRSVLDQTLRRSGSTETGLLYRETGDSIVAALGGTAALEFALRVSGAAGRILARSFRRRAPILWDIYLDEGFPGSVATLLGWDRSPIERTTMRG